MNQSMDELPLIRNLQAFPANEQGRQLFLLKDPEGYAPLQATISQEVLFICQHLDGQSTRQNLCQAYQSQFRQDLSQEQLRDILEFLDENYFLETSRFESRRKSIDALFYDSPLRPYVCFDPETVDSIRQTLDENFTKAGYVPATEIKAEPESLLGIIAPHIDFDRGSKVYGSAYGRLFSQFDGDRIIILGTNHQEGDSHFITTAKSFDTPFGVMQTDAQAVREIADRIDGDTFADEIAHRNEHSVELAATVLAYAGKKDGVKIIPILVSGINESLPNDNSPQNISQVKSAIEAIKWYLAKRPGKTAIIASADLSHVGTQFGDSFMIDQPQWERIAQQDNQLLEAACKKDADTFFALGANPETNNHVCGLGPIYVAVSALPQFKGHIEDYAQWIAEDNTGLVSFAAVSMKKV